MGAQESLPHDTETPAQRLDALLAGAHIGGEFNNRGPNPKASLTLAEALTCAFFVGTIASSFIDVNETHAVGINDGIKEQRIASREYAPTISSDALWCPWHTIRVSRPSPQIEKFSSVLYVQNILRCQRRLMWNMWRLSCRTTPFRPQHSCSGTLEGIKVIEIKVCRDRCVAEKTVAVQLQILRRGVAAILPDRHHSPVEMPGPDIRLIHGLYSGCKDECSFVCNECLSGQLRLLASGDPQSAGEGRDDDGRQRSNRRLIRFYKPTRASYVAINSDTESGWVFFGGPSALSLS
jgi:hypothetical protein